MKKILAKMKVWDMTTLNFNVMKGKNWNIPMCGPFYEKEIEISTLIAI
ncbi:MAG: hypothetical protein NTV58_06160 [Deltaproteobacteria bacterium]|nr:hypothetical protein [Deltaproteobacteria bacterium]